MTLAADIASVVEAVEWAEEATTIQNENGIVLKTPEELVVAYKRRLMRAFIIN